MSQPVRILQITQIVPLWGVDLFQTLAQAFSDSNYEITTVFIAGAPQPALAAQYPGQVVFLNINHKALFWRFKAIYRLWQLCRQQQFDVVFCHHYKALVLVDALARLLKIPKRYNIHHNMGNFRYLTRKLYARFMLSRQWRFITISNAVKADLNAAGLAASRIEVIYNSVDIDKIKAQMHSRQEARAELGLAEDAFVFGSLGRFVHDKGQIYLLQAFAAIANKLPKTSRCVLIGRGALKCYLQEQAEQLGISQQVVINDTVASQAVCFLPAFDVFVFPSVQEGFGLALVEAMLAGLPIITTQAGGIPEVMANTGVLVPAKDSVLLALAMLKVYADLTSGSLQITSETYQDRIQQFSHAVYQQRFRELVS